ncbi:hypothetical protein [Actinophytocola glycyrrhizae]|uniref:Uncharacterized protein n=1 Tax=Actinophytocola glycyrrhizae TaxID=2044873 RepID=A0ABV9SEJ5_9PSEU
MVDVAGHRIVDVVAQGFRALTAEPKAALDNRATLDPTPAPHDYSDEVVVLGRLKPGTTTESRRVVHVFKLVRDVLHQPMVTARCGMSLPVDDLQWLPRLAGMPCELCVMASAS